jgi:hypothetical protein
VPRLTPAERERLRLARAVQVVWWLACGCVLTEAQIAERLGVSEEAAGALLDAVSEWVPVYDDRQGKWRLK